MHRDCKFHAFFLAFFLQKRQSSENIETTHCLSRCSWVKVNCNGSFCQVPFGIAYPSAACYARPALTNWARRPQRGKASRHQMVRQHFKWPLKATVAPISYDLSGCSLFELVIFYFLQNQRSKHEIIGTFSA